MSATPLNIVPVMPEIFVLIMACITLLIGAFTKKQHSGLPYCLIQLTLIIAAVLSWYVFTTMDESKTVMAFHNTFVLDRFAVVLKIFIFISVFFTFFYSRQYNDERKIPATEFYVLGLLSTLGMMVLVSSPNLLTLYLGVELMSLPTYVMVAMQRKKSECVEASMKYFIIGAVASAMLLYGLSMLFGATKSLDVATIAQTVSTTASSHQMLLVFGLVFIVAGLAFKLGAAPFHMWVPDVYQGAPTSVTLFISTAPKIAGFGLVIRLLAGAMPSLQMQWQEMLIVIAILSMCVGNFAAIVQTNVKRMLAYSSIAHIGYMLLGILCGTASGYASAMFYIISYSIMTLGAFGMILLMAREGFEAENISDFVGLNNRNPWLAFLILIIMFSLAGIPPLVGFIAKVGVLESLISVHLVWLTVVALVFAIVGSYYYLRIVKVMYFEKGDENVKPVAYSTGLNVVMTLNGLAVLLLGILPGALFALCHLAF